MVNLENYEEYMMMYADGELNEAETKALMDFVDANPELAKELEAYSATKLVPDTELTRREVQIIKLICDKKTNNEIARLLSLSVRTIEGHRYNICKKTNTSNTLELIEFVVQNNLLAIYG